MRLRETLIGCQGKWTVSYSNCDYIRRLYEDYHIMTVNRINSLAQRYGQGRGFPEMITTNYDPQGQKKWDSQ